MASLPGTADRLVATARTGQAGRHVAQAWVASRALILVIAVLLALAQRRPVGDLVNNWDAALYAELAYNGYFSDPRGTLMAFFPGFPAVLHLGLAIGVPTQATGMIICAVGSAAAAAALLRLGGPVAAIAWLFAPTAVFTVVPYTEAMFCAAAFWAWERARADRWGWACLLACIACTVRVSGVFLVGALAVMIITGRRTGAGRSAGAEVRTRLVRLAWLVPPALVVLGYVIYLRVLTGSWIAWYTAQSTGWVRGLTLPWQSVINTWQAIAPGAFADHPWWAVVFRLEVVSMAVGLITTGWCLGRRRWAEAAWVGVQVLAFSLSYWLFSVNRAVLLWFPTWIMIAELVAIRPAGRVGRVIRAVLIMVGGAVALVGMVWWTWLFLTGHWAS